ncbi:hypothetical protein H6G36_06580 [Anabaena minutissima FACHB-250]|nr:hypothetical protein [Anabaena minutissima FACHB-250]
MKSFKKLSSIAVLVCAFIYPSSIAQAKDISLDNLYTQGFGTETNLVAAENGELLLVRRDDDGRRRYIRRRQNARRQFIRRQQIRRQIRRRQNARRRFIRRQNLRPVYIRRRQIRRRYDY